MKNMFFALAVVAFSSSASAMADLYSVCTVTKLPMMTLIDGSIEYWDVEECHLAGPMVPAGFNEPGSI